ncbi:uncharacterized protein TRIADDRAFT_54462 [Trichoplax adhaerens]|uniref:Right handed beta helix domain-containing protein n=1 Tax=Trichoplax adhaerens TaxID=10228 RepID=B3RS38_TRIAD|nr:hypothetical protein TRIADDRAFT_54462 [Trichoplax adhaerens]EDV26985.1 hypothetical protein TRIADDRAFT_54462 [Trichoplax adhaerens]|eukprot:XP_002110981.1 hypothetical protein TRIADDRAFT_54462 [Trichoplax adhaerens]
MIEKNEILIQILLFLSIGTFLCSASSTCQTEIHRDMYESVTWGIQGSPYCLNFAHIRILSGATLTIEPGVVVHFHQFSRLSIEGRLNATGLPNKYIHFIDERKGMDIIKFQPSLYSIPNRAKCQDLRSILSYCNITGSRYGILAANTFLQLDHVHVHGSYIGIKAIDCWIRIRHSTITGGHTGGISIKNIRQNSKLSTCKAIEIMNNTVTKAITWGVLIELAQISVQQYIRISNNRIIHNNQGIKIIGKGKSLTIVDNFIGNNSGTAMDIKFTGVVNIVRNHVVKNKANGASIIHVRPSSAFNITIKDNIINGNTASGNILYLDQNYYQQFIRNQIMDNIITPMNNSPILGSTLVRDQSEEQLACAIYFNFINIVDARNNTFANKKLNCEIDVSHSSAGYLDARYCYWGSINVYFITERIINTIVSPVVYSSYLTGPNDKVYQNDPFLHFGAILNHETWTNFDGTNRIHRILNRTVLILLPGTQLTIDSDQSLLVTQDVGIYAEGTVTNPVIIKINRRGKIITHQNSTTSFPPLIFQNCSIQNYQINKMTGQLYFRNVNFNSDGESDSIIIQSGKPKFCQCNFTQGSSIMLKYNYGQNSIEIQNLVGQNVINGCTIYGRKGNGLSISSKWNKSIQPLNLTIQDCYFTSLKVAISIQDYAASGCLNIKNNTFHSIYQSALLFKQSQNRLMLLLTIQDNQLINNNYSKQPLIDLLCHPNNSKIDIAISKNNFTSNYCGNFLLQVFCQYHINNHYGHKSKQPSNRRINIKENFFNMNEIHQTDLISLWIDDSSQFSHNILINTVKTRNTNQDVCIVKNRANSPLYQWNYFNNEQITFQLCNLAAFSYHKMINAGYNYWGVDHYDNITTRIYDTRWNSKLSYVNYNNFNNRQKKTFQANFTIHSGILHSNATWLKKDNPHLIYLSLTISPDVVLRIQPGVVIYLDIASQINVLGSITAVGIPSLPITFTSVEQYDYNHRNRLYWNQIQFYDNNRLSLLQNCLFKYGGLWKTMIHVANPNVRMINTTLAMSYKQLFSVSDNITKQICYNCTLIKKLSSKNMTENFTTISIRSNYANHQIIAIDIPQIDYHIHQLAVLVPYASTEEINEQNHTTWNNYTWIYPIKQASMYLHWKTNRTDSNRTLPVEIEIWNKTAQEKILSIVVPLLLAVSSNIPDSSETVTATQVFNGNHYGTEQSSLNHATQLTWNLATSSIIASQSLTLSLNSQFSSVFDQSRDSYSQSLYNSDSSGDEVRPSTRKSLLYQGWSSMTASSTFDFYRNTFVGDFKTTSILARDFNHNGSTVFVTTATSSSMLSNKVLPVTTSYRILDSSNTKTTPLSFTTSNLTPYKVSSMKGYSTTSDGLVTAIISKATSNLSFSIMASGSSAIAAFNSPELTSTPVISITSQISDSTMKTSNELSSNYEFAAAMLPRSTIIMPSSKITSITSSIEIYDGQELTTWLSSTFAVTKSTTELYNNIRSTALSLPIVSPVISSDESRISTMFSESYTPINDIRSLSKDFSKVLSSQITSVSYTSINDIRSLSKDFSQVLSNQITPVSYTSTNDITSLSKDLSQILSSQITSVSYTSINDITSLSKDLSQMLSSQITPVSYTSINDITTLSKDLSQVLSSQITPVSYTSINDITSLSKDFSQVLSSQIISLKLPMVYSKLSSSYSVDQTDVTILTRSLSNDHDKMTILASTATLSSDSLTEYLSSKLESKSRLNTMIHNTINAMKSSIAPSNIDSSDCCSQSNILTTSMVTKSLTSTSRESYNEDTRQSMSRLDVTTHTIEERLIQESQLIQSTSITSEMISQTALTEMNSFATPSNFNKTILLNESGNIVGVTVSLVAVVIVIIIVAIIKVKKPTFRLWSYNSNRIRAAHDMELPIYLPEGSKNHSAGSL